MNCGGQGAGVTEITDDRFDTFGQDGLGTAAHHANAMARLNQERHEVLAEVPGSSD